MFAVGRSCFLRAANPRGKAWDFLAATQRRSSTCSSSSTLKVMLCLSSASRITRVTLAKCSSTAPSRIEPQTQQLALVRQPFGYFGGVTARNAEVTNSAGSTSCWRWFRTGCATAALGPFPHFGPGAVSSLRSGAFLGAAGDDYHLVARLTRCLHPSSAFAHPMRNFREGWKHLRPFPSRLSQIKRPRCERPLPRRCRALTPPVTAARGTQGDRDCGPAGHPPCASTHATYHQLQLSAWQRVQ